MIKTWTGERLETFVNKDTATQHLHRYALAIDFIKGKRVLDIASGEGYGSNLMSKYAAGVIGVDIDEAAINAAIEKYKAGNLEFRLGKADDIPVPDNSMDVVISFETLEHHDRHHEMMKEIKRVLRNDGILIMSTPEKKAYSDDARHVNPFHVKELYLHEFKDLINNYFTDVHFYFQDIFKGSLIIPENESTKYTIYEGDFREINPAKSFSPKYVLSIASDTALPEYKKMSAFNGQNILIMEQQELLEKNRTQVREDTIRWIKSSWSFRIGEAIVAPARMVKKMIRFKK